MSLERSLAWYGVTLDVDPGPCLQPLRLVRGAKGRYTTSFDGRLTSVHVAAWALLNGRWPCPGEDVRHLCNGGSGSNGCCNPYHQAIGTRRDNSADARASGRLAVGERIASARLTRENVVEIRRLVAEGTSQSEVARQFNVHRPTVNRIVNRRRWRHVE